MNEGPRCKWTGCRKIAATVHGMCPLHWDKKAPPVPRRKHDQFEDERCTEEGCTKRAVNAKGKCQRHTGEGGRDYYVGNYEVGRYWRVSPDGMGMSRIIGAHKDRDDPIGRIAHHTQRRHRPNDGD